MVGASRGFLPFVPFDSPAQLGRGVILLISWLLDSGLRIVDLYSVALSVESMKSLVNREKRWGINLFLGFKKSY